ncbi:MAG: hypothetical protein J1E39_08215 [Eubacterium sp.]|nr:hypothetical protein [Eubacterium sp.]
MILNEMGLKLKIYNILVNRKRLIKYKYEAYVGMLGGKGNFKAWLYLLRLNFRYYILHDRSTSVKKVKQRLSLVPCESALYKPDETPEQLAERLSKYGCVSFDIFDTLIFRRTAKPTDVFYFIGEKLCCSDFRRLRTEAEKKAREIKHAESGSYEINIYDIARRLSAVTAIDEQRLIDAELEAETKLCFANPYMKQVWDCLINKGVKPVILSDMYLPAPLMERLLNACGYSGWGELYVSCDTDTSKYDGSAYKMLKEKHPAQSYIHVGDNPRSDIENARRHGFETVRCANPNDDAGRYRTRDISPVTGSLWAGIVNSRMHSRDAVYDKYYELGYVYGGLLVYGYCNFIDKYAKEKNIDKIFFLARDGYIVKEIYDRYFGSFDTEYVYWSRTAGSVISADAFPQDFVEKYILQKVSACDIIGKIAEETGLSSLSAEITADTGLDMNARLDSSTANVLAEWVYDNREKVVGCFTAEKSAAAQYVRDKLGKAERILTVDCGWAGSGHISLSSLIKQIKPSAVTYGALCGTNNAYHLYADTVDVMFADDSMRAYCFSSAHNRDLYEYHSPALRHNLYFEMLLSSEEGSLLRFELQDGQAVPILSDNPNKDYVRLIHEGIRQFAEDISKAGYEFINNISGRDAYAPFKSAAENGLFESYKEYVFEEHTMKRS